MLELIQIKLRHVFADEQLLHSALRSAHREKDDSVLDDGNRGLAHYGNLVVQMAMTYEAIIDKGRPIYDVHVQDHWSRTKKGRAKACKLLGIEPLIMRSVRQQNQSPSDTVLDHALSAVLGAISLDCERQEHNNVQIRATILEVLRTIDAIMDKDSAMADCARNADRSPTDQCVSITNSSEGQPETTDLECGDLGDFDRFAREWFEQVVHDSSTNHLLLPQSPTLELQPSPGQDGCVLSPDSCSVHAVNAPTPSSDVTLSAYRGPGIQSCSEDSRSERQGNESLNTGSFQLPRSTLRNESSDEATNDEAMSVGGSTRKRDQNGEEKLTSVHHNMLQAERTKLTYMPKVDQEHLIQFLEHPTLEKLETKFSVLARFLYLAIGSWDTIVAFEDLCQLAKNNTSFYRRPDLLSQNSAAMYAEICRLEKEEALSVLLRRYYILSLCEEEQLYNDHYDHIIVETPSTVSEGIAVKAGNPVFAMDSSLTERLLIKIMPNSDPESEEFRKARAKVKRLRKLAGRLRQLVKLYGIGILGLLPSGPSFEQMSLTDNMLTSMTQTNFDDFVKLIHEGQGTHLESLSRLIEPYLLAVVTGYLNSDATCLLERSNVSLLANLPKGLLRQGLLC